MRSLETSTCGSNGQVDRPISRRLSHNGSNDLSICPKLAAFSLIAIDVLFAAAIAFVLCLGFPAQAHAYVDPSVMTYTIQALAGVAVALSAVIGVFWRRVKRFMMKVFNIDENRGKSVEPDVHRIGDAGYDPSCVQNMEADAVQGHAHKKRGGPAVAAISWPKRIIIALIVSFSFFFTLVFVSPIELVYGGADDLAFDARDVAMLLGVTTAIATVVVALLLSILRGKAFYLALAVVFAISLCMFLQPLLMNDGLPAADGHAVDWSMHTAYAMVNAAVWLAVIVASCVLAVKRPHVAGAAICVLAVVVILAQGVNGALILHRSNKVGEQNLVTQDGLYEVSDKNNVIVFLVDTVDTNQFEQLIDSDPDVLDGFDGFTFFPDSAGTMIPTAYAVPFLTTGEHLQRDETMMEYRERRFGDSTFMQDIKDAGYSISLYADCLYSGVDEFSDLTVNLHGIESVPVKTFSALDILCRASMYRDMPWILKPFFWFYTSDMNTYVIDEDGESALDSTPFVVDDPHFYQGLQKHGLSYERDGEENGAFKFIHMTGSHVPYTMNAQGEYVETGTSLEEQTTGAFNIIHDYLDRLKEMGKYDDATIIIMADHGIWQGSVDQITVPSTPLVMIKPSQGPGEAFEGIRVDHSPVSQDDFQATVLEAMGVDGSKYGSSYFADKDPNRIRYYYQLMPGEDGDRYLYEVRIDGDARDFSNWTITGNRWYPDEGPQNG